jgi:hypothetical protein
LAPLALDGMAAPQPAVERRPSNNHLERIQHGSVGDSPPAAPGEHPLDPAIVPHA